MLNRLIPAILLGLTLCNCSPCDFDKDEELRKLAEWRRFDSAVKRETAYLPLPDSAEPFNVSELDRKWLHRRYGIRSAYLFRVIISGRDTFEQFMKFADFGALESVWTYRPGSGDPVRREVLTDGCLRLHEPLMTLKILNNGCALTSLDAGRLDDGRPWSPTFPTALPNFNCLTEQMRREFKVEQTTDTAVILERECIAYRLQRGGREAMIWVWKGIPLHIVVTDRSGKSEKMISTVMLAPVNKPPSPSDFDLPESDSVRFLGYPPPEDLKEEPEEQQELPLSQIILHKTPKATNRANRISYPSLLPISFSSESSRWASSTPLTR